jgi:hypothetical protein
MYQQQNRLLYQPKIEKISPQDVGADAAEIINVTTKDGLSLEGWYFPPSHENKKVIVFFHGNRWVIGDSFYFARDYLNYNYGLLMVEFRGYAGHKGRVTEQGLYADSRAYIDWLHTEKGVPYSDMIFYGESLGTSLAVKMASEYTPHAVVLLAPFITMIDAAKQHYPYIPVSILLKDTYLNDKAIKKVSSPVLILHGKNDRLVNYKFGQKLYEEANEPKEIVIFEYGNHVNLYDLGAHKVIRDYLDKLNESSKSQSIQQKRAL